MSEKEILNKQGIIDRFSDPTVEVKTEELKAVFEGFDPDVDRNGIIRIIQARLQSYHVRYLSEQYKENENGFTIRAFEGAISHIKENSASRLKDDSEYLKEMMNFEYKPQRRNGVSYASQEVLKSIPKMYESFRDIVRKKHPNSKMISEEDIKGNFLACVLGAKNRIAELAAKEVNKTRAEEKGTEEKGDAGIGRND